MTKSKTEKLDEKWESVSETTSEGGFSKKELNVTLSQQCQRLVIGQVKIKRTELKNMH